MVAKARKPNHRLHRGPPAFELHRTPTRPPGCAWSVVVLPTPQTSGPSGAPHPSTPSSLSGSSLPQASPWSAKTPSPPWSRDPAGLPRTSRPVMSPWTVALSAPHGSTLPPAPHLSVDPQISSGPSAKAAPWILPPSAPTWDLPLPALPGSCLSPALRPSPEPPPSFHYWTIYGMRTCLLGEECNVRSMFRFMDDILYRFLIVPVSLLCLVSVSLDTDYILICLYRSLVQYRPNLFVAT